MTISFTPRIDNYKFWPRFCAITKMALTAGEPKLRLQNGTIDFAKIPAKEKVEFYKACHRGYEKAQHSIIQAIIDIRDDESLSREEKKYFELLLRRVIDSIAFLLFGGEIHIVRRLSISDKVSSINIDDILSSKQIVDYYNKESRLTFALFSDLSTYIQVGDIIRIDFRKGKPKIAIIEVKSGKVNHILDDFLDRFHIQPESLEVIKNCKAIKSSHKKQAIRMMKQRIRMTQLHQLLTTDVGIDIKTGHNMTFPAKRVETLDYGRELSEVCDDAIEKGWGGVRIDETIHAIAFQSDLLNDDPMLAQRLLAESLINSRCACSTIMETEKELMTYCAKNEIVRVTNPIKTNLLAMACTPCLVWPIKKCHINHLLCGKVQLLFAFDTPGFIKLLQDIGANLKFTTRQEAESIKKDFGRAASFSWGGKFMIINGITQLGGVFSRIINDLISPSSLVKGLLEQDLDQEKTYHN